MSKTTRGRAYLVKQGSDGLWYVRLKLATAKPGQKPRQVGEGYVSKWGATRGAKRRAKTDGYPGATVVVE